MNKDEILEAFSFYREVTDAERHVLRDAASAASLEPGATFYRQGEVGREFGLVGRGDIRVFKPRRTAAS